MLVPMCVDVVDVLIHRPHIGRKAATSPTSAQSPYTRVPKGSTFRSIVVRCKRNLNFHDCRVLGARRRPPQRPTDAAPKKGERKRATPVAQLERGTKAPTRQEKARRAHAVVLAYGRPIYSGIPTHRICQNSRLTVTRSIITVGAPHSSTGKALHVGRGAFCISRFLSQQLFAEFALDIDWQFYYGLVAADPLQVTGTMANAPTATLMWWGSLFCIILTLSCQVSLT
jgi:hypothetical protein